MTALVSTVVSGLLAGTSSGLSQSKNQGGKTRPYGQNDTYYAPTNYGSYGPYYDTRPVSSFSTCATTLVAITENYILQ